MTGIESIEDLIRKASEGRPEIKLSQEPKIVELLRQELAKCRAILQEQAPNFERQPPESRPLLETAYKVVILEKLLAKGVANTFRLGGDLIVKYQGLTDGAFKEAYAAVERLNNAGEETEQTA